MEAPTEAYTKVRKRRTISWELRHFSGISTDTGIDLPPAPRCYEIARQAQRTQDRTANDTRPLGLSLGHPVLARPDKQSGAARGPAKTREDRSFHWFGAAENAPLTWIPRIAEELELA
jgi:hypothetical protein